MILRNIPERSIQGAGEFRRVTHQRTLVPEPGIYQTTFDSLYTSVHHVARSDTVCSSPSIVNSNFSNAVNGRWGVDGPIVI